MINGKQCRAARALMDISQSELAERIDLTRLTIANFEKGEKISLNSMESITSFFDNNSIVFLPNDGVAAKPVDEVQKLYGREGFAAFMNDVYETVKKHGGEICVSNVDEKNWIEWMTKAGYKKHSERMKELKDFNFKIFIEEGDDFYIADEFAEYRAVPSEFFCDQSFYAYGDKLALIAFDIDTVRINIIKNPKWAESFRVLFNFAWKNAQKLEPWNN